MKVAVLIDTWFPFVGGGQINALEISKRLSQKGQQVEIITRNCGKDSLKSFKNLKITKLGKLSKSGDDIARLKYLVQALIYITQNNFDLVVAHAFLPGLVAGLVMIIKKKPAILVVHGTSIGTELNKGAKALLEKFILTKIKYSAQITVSRDFLKMTNVNKNVVYIPNGVDQVFFRSNSSFKREKNTLLFVGRLHPQKNLVSLIEAMKLLNFEKFPVKLIIIGDGPQKQEILALIKKYKLKSKIKLEGTKHGPELIKYFHSSSAFILPSIYEGQPLTLLEAWASSLPVIVSKTGDNRYLVKDGQNGYFITNQNDPKNIAQTIKKSLLDKNLSNIGKNGNLEVKNNLSWDLSTQKTLDLIATFKK